MPKRTTTTYSSEDAPDTSDKIYVYYCRYCGDHAFITDALLEKMPRRKTDRAYVIDTQINHVKLSVIPASVKYIRRGEGKCEKQFRYNCGTLPVLYKAEEYGRYIYIMDNAVSAYANAEDVAQAQLAPRGPHHAGASPTPAAEVPVPPCIQLHKSGKVQIGLDIEDKTERVGILRITSDEVGIQVIVSGQKGQEYQMEVLEYLGKVLKLRLVQMELQKGWSNRSRVLMCEGITPQEVHERLQNALEASKKSLIAQADLESKRVTHAEQLDKLPQMGLMM